MKIKFLQRQRTLRLVLISLLMTAGIAIANAQAPTGAINGVFSVGENTVVYFSQGNLQYKASTNKWQFATHQYDYIGSANSNISSTYSGWIDLFGWGTSGYHDSSDPYNVNYQPWSTSYATVNRDYNYFGYGPSTNMSDPNLTGSSANYDWGVYNAISNGGNTASTWRTLTKVEWNYLFNTRATSSGIRYAKATVNGVNGVILLPDDWSADYYTLSNTNTSGASFSSNVITASQWATLEQHGAVFLPAAGYRYGTSVYSVGSTAYWSASYGNSNYAYGVNFNDGGLNASYSSNRSYGRSVRLVCPVENYSIHATLSPAEGGAVSGAGAYMAGAECTLTATASAGYTFAYWTEDGEVVSTDAEYTFTVTGYRTLVANFTQNGSMGKLNGQFTVGENTVVLFSQGNLQYKGSTNTWRFAENQYDYVGSDNLNISQTYSGLIDLFGWGTSGYNHGAVCYQPWSTSTSSESYYAYGNSQYNLFDQTCKADWGYNAISNGGNQEHSGWRTLTREEWYYLFNTRVTSSGIRYAKARVNNVSGVILLPDDWQTSYYSLNSTNTSGASFSTNVITVTQWNTLQQHGAVFLPAAGYRDGISVYDVGSRAYYWSASCIGYSSNAYYVDFYGGNLSASHGDFRYYGHSVRLVRAVENYSIHATPNPAEGGAVSGAGAYLEGAECTLTATASAGYTFAYWTLNGRVVSTDAVYTFTVTGDRTLVANFTQNGSMGKLNGQFTVGENAVVCFSQGNLQYKASTNTWRFAENQYDYVGSDNSNISQTYSGLIDLFGWGTSGYNHGANCYQPWSTSTSSSDYYAYGNSGYNLFDQTGKADWGYNAISNGGNQEHSGWRTLTREEWYYLFNTRVTSSGIRYAKARVNNVSGVILLPDDWQTSYYSLNSTNTSGASFSTNVITVTQWNTLQQHGAVFLPAAGYRGTSVYDVGSYGYYWSASYHDSNIAYGVRFGDGLLGASGVSSRECGLSVRLVRTVENYSIHATPNPAEGGAVSGAGAYQAGAECTLTATASAGYTFAYWTENGEVVSTDAEYTFTVTGDRTLVANFTQNGSMGKLNGQFTVGENTVVFFSQGNLQYKGSTNTWRFAENQYDYIGSTNSNISSSYTGWIDLFGWGTSGYNHGANCYQPWSTSTSSSDYYAYGNSQYNLFDQTGKADWGYNAIINGGNTENSGWRTLTREEWNYLFNTRFTSSGIRYAKARVNNVSGVILLPDDWQTSYYSLNSTNTSGASFSTNVITVTQWNTLQQHGVVFLPAAGYRSGSSVGSVGSYGGYWSASYGSNDGAYRVYFSDGYLNASYYSNFYYGHSVRLVRPVENFSIHATPSPAEGGAVSGAGAYLEGAECTLTATASAGYTFAYWTENGEVVSTEATYSFTVTCDRVLVAHFELTEPIGPNPNAVVITLDPGWNWISYLLTTEIPLVDALVNLSPSDGDMMKGQGSFSTYNAATGLWSGSLTSLVPGKGYIYLSNDTQSKTFTYPGERGN